MNNNNQYSTEQIEDKVSHFWELVASKYPKPENSEFKLPDRTWPDNDTKQAPIWCESGLRDGKQSIEFMSFQDSLEYFNILVNMWFKEIEVWFPSASNNDLMFVRHLIDNNLIPENVKIQVLVPARKDLIKKTREALEWAKNVILHLYLSTSTIQREVVLNKTPDEIIELGVQWVKWLKENFNDFEWNIFFQISPESFTWTEMDFAEEFSRETIKEWWDFGWNEVILNLPATVENSKPSTYADKIEYFVRVSEEIQAEVKLWIDIIISVHTHNDRGCAIAAAELALDAWARRVEWVLWWNGERTWNADLYTIAANLATRWISPNLDLSHLWVTSQRISEIINIPIHPRNPYTWDLVNTAFSWSHQDAIAKWLKEQKRREQAWDPVWNVPYLPFDPEDFWLEYTPIQISALSWSGWVNAILEWFWYTKIPKNMQKIIWQIIQWVVENKEEKLENEEVVKIFETHFVNMTWKIKSDNFDVEQGDTSWIIDEFSNHLKNENSIDFILKDYAEYSITSWSDSEALSYIVIEYDWKEYWWVWKDKDIVLSAKKWLISALNRATGE